MTSILLVEDEKWLGDNISMLLKKEGYEVLYVRNGLEALDILNDNIPDLIISDIIMPYVDGYELFRKTKQNFRTQFVPFLFLTCKNDPISFRKGMNLGADDYISKPFVFDELLHAIKIRLEKSSLISAKIDNLRSNIGKYVPHELRTPLVAILGYSQMVINENMLLSKDEIVDMVERIYIGANRLKARIEKFLLFTELEPVINKFKMRIKPHTIFNYNTLKMIILNHYFIKNRKEDIHAKIIEATVKIPDFYLERIIVELLENAVKFSEMRSIIYVTGKINADYYYLEIKNTGRGMKKSETEQIEAFVQFNREVFQQEGNGLGLAIVKRILKMYNGKILIESLEDKFTTVTVEIPLAN